MLSGHELWLESHISHFVKKIISWYWGGGDPSKLNIWTQALWVKLGRRKYLEAIDSYVSTKSQVIVTEGLVLFKLLTMTD